MNGEQFMDIVFGAIEKGKSPPQLFMATVASVDNNTNPAGARAFLKFDGSTDGSPYSFPMLNSAYPLSTDQRVLVARIGSSYLIVDKVKTYT